MTVLVVSGAPGTGKSTIAAGLAAEDWSNRLGGAASDASGRSASSPDRWKCSVTARRISPYDECRRVTVSADTRSTADVINPSLLLDRVAELAATVTPLRLGAGLVDSDTSADHALHSAVTAVQALLG